MNREAAVSWLGDLYAGALPPFSVLPTTAVDNSRVVDTAGRTPDDPLYVETIDQWWAAAELAERLAIVDATTPPAQVLEQVTSEGTTLRMSSTAPTDWWAVARALRARSLLVAGQGIGTIVLDEPRPRYWPRSEVRW